MDCSLPGSSLHGILQARVLEWVAISFSRGSSRPRDWTLVSCIPGRLLNLWATREGFDLGHTWSSGFPYFLQFNSKFGNKEFMIWATVSSQPCFCWLYRAFPSLAAKNIIHLISVLTIWWWPCVVFSCVVGTECLLWPVDSLGRTLLAFFLLHSVLQGQICLLLQALDFLLWHSSALCWKDIFHGVSSKRACRSSFERN